MPLLSGRVGHIAIVVLAVGHVEPHVGDEMPARAQHPDVPRGVSDTVADLVGALRVHKSPRPERAGFGGGPLLRRAPV